MQKDLEKKYNKKVNSLTDYFYLIDAELTELFELGSDLERMKFIQKQMNFILAHSFVAEKEEQKLYKLFISRMMNPVL